MGTLNEVFWSAFFATLNEILYENREGEFYGYGGKIYDPTSEHLLRQQLTNDICERPRSGLDTWPCRNYATQDILVVFLPISRV